MENNRHLWEENFSFVSDKENTNIKKYEEPKMSKWDLKTVGNTETYWFLLNLDTVFLLSNTEMSMILTLHSVIMSIIGNSLTICF